MRRWRFKRVSRHWVWCDMHGEMHGKTDDPYRIGESDCNPEEWRPVYIATNSAQDEDL